MNSPAVQSLSMQQLLSELLSLHELERQLMIEQRHAEHQQCVSRKLDLSHQIHFVLEQGFILTEEHRPLVEMIQQAAIINASIAEQMLQKALHKIEMIRTYSSASYSAEGKTDHPFHQGGLLNLQA